MIGDGPPDSPQDEQRPMRILYAEDCENNVMLISFYLQKLPYQLDSAENGQVAVDMYRAEPYDVVLMDIQMPVMDGYEATREIRRIEQERGLAPCPVIAITAHALEENRKKAMDAGCNVFLTKPVRKVQLVETIQELTAKA
jgi:CheY-like chemotaxis protein